jgi:hypothetical protein
MRRFAISAIVITLVLCVAWAAIWAYARNVVATRVDEVLATSSPAEIVCADRSVSGFPFRMALSCSKAGLREPSRALTADLGGVRVSALAYRPRHVIAEFTAPLNVAWNVPPSELNADWSEGQASLRITGQALGRLSGEFDDFKLATEQQAIAGRHTEFYARPADEGRQTDLAWSALDATFGLDGEISAPFSLDTKMRVDMPPEDLMAGGLAGRDIAIPDLDLRLTAGDARLSAKGDVTVDQAGTANGTIVIVTENLPALASFMQTLPTAVRNRAQTLVGGVIALSKPTTNDQGAQVSELTLTIRDNAIFAGTRQIGVLGPGS